MHLVNDYLHFELKHINSQPTHIVILVMFRVSDHDSSSYPWNARKKMHYWLIVIAPWICVQRVHTVRKRKELECFKTTREQNLFYFPTSLTEPVRNINRWKGWKCIVKTRHKTLMVVLYNRGKSCLNKAKSNASVAHCITASLLHKYRYTI